MTTDLELARAIQRGSESACTLFVERYRTLCFHIVRRFVSSDDEAFDLCQDTFLRALDRMPQFRGEGSLASWVGRIAFNIGQRRAEQQRARREVSWDAADQSQDRPLSDALLAQDDAQHRLEVEDTQQQLHTALRTLSTTEQTVISLFYLDELSLTEIAAVTGLREGTIKSHLSRGRQRLRRAYDAGGDSSPPLL